MIVRNRQSWSWVRVVKASEPFDAIQVGESFVSLARASRGPRRHSHTHVGERKINKQIGFENSASPPPPPLFPPGAWRPKKMVVLEKSDQDQKF